MLRNPKDLDWIALTAAAVVGLLTGVGSTSLNLAEQIALGVTIGLATAIVLQIALRLLGGKRRR